MSRILVTDLDGTLLGGSPDSRRRLRDALERHPEVTVVFATGRALDSVRELLRDPLVPRPRWIIADVGATVIDGTDFTPVDPLQEQLRTGWPGAAQVRAALRRFPALRYQEGVVQDGRCSYHLTPSALTPELTDAVRALGCTWEYSAARYFDVLPPGASKGNALRLLARKLGWAAEEVLVAGDSLNDLSLFRLGTHAVVVKGAESALLTALADSPHVHRPEGYGAAGILTALRAMGWLPPPATGGATARQRHSLVVGYHRPPLRWTGTHWRPPASPNGILPTLTSAFTDGLPGVWVAALAGSHAGSTHTPPPAGLPLSLVPFTSAEWTGYFHRACKETLWPVLMSAPDRSVHDERTWAHYRAVNARFAERISAHAAPGATVWLHDYNLWLVPGLLRATRPDLRTGLFHHTPFPPPEVFATLPAATEIRASLACLDWAGFHTAAFADRFRHTLADQPGRPHTAVHPLGIDRPAIEALARDRAPLAPPAIGLRVLSVERLDYAKAPVQKVDAVARLLACRPELRGRLTFRLVCPPPEPGITAYDATRDLLEQRINQVNSTWQQATWKPVEYVPRNLPVTAVIDEYLAADVLWVASLQDGMNLTAKEFIAAQAALLRHRAHPPGALVLSRHAGAAAQLGDAALLTDPNCPEDLTTILSRALDLSPAERRTRMDRLAGLIGHERPADWAARIIDEIRNARTTPCI
ncbi:HAD superfamily hydrolase (TIGR01484 family) [Kitasatospora sp. GP30]|uniref:HAD-IIB family hydrolase n=1 Tax=Kitasatospora sp. GP30 TaxID=3035084 RepID=UPI000C712CD4|nr:HAD-IIB family hydrolase [Kitasatospora sp. GP30]MDH6143740.1 HAD superfamily hydrolase (TIGR01484 family) [Kitasatospora sp. GP30]